MLMVRRMLLLMSLLTTFRGCVLGCVLQLPNTAARPRPINYLVCELSMHGRDDRYIANNRQVGPCTTGFAICPSLKHDGDAVTDWSPLKGLPALPKPHHSWLSWEPLFLDPASAITQDVVRITGSCSICACFGEHARLQNVFFNGCSAFLTRISAVMRCRRPPTAATGDLTPVRTTPPVEPRSR
eukprot:SAG11_NODE_260_length_11531_cov_6.271781_4_plen_184_part_00